MAAQNLPAKKEETLRQLFDNPALKRQVQMAIPKHMTVDRLLRVAMTAIRTNPKLMECTPRSLLACIMGAAQLGLEPEPFLGQAYFVPFKNKMGQYEAQLIPGYRGYITLARRTGEVQSVSAQVVYSNDHFRLQYGLNETLDHEPADGDRGEFKGAYVVFRYKDGGHSFDYMTKGDIDLIRARSKAKDSGPWVTDYPEMAKKTVIRRHIKLAPLSIEMAKAASLEEKAILGEDQSEMILGNNQPELMAPEEPPAFEELVAEAKEPFNPIMLGNFLEVTAKGNSSTVDQVREMARKNWDKFWAAFLKWQAAQGKSKPTESRGKTKEEPKASPEARESKEPEGKGPEEGNGGFVVCSKRQGDEMTRGFCRTACPDYEGHPVDCPDYQSESI